MTTKNFIKKKNKIVKRVTGITLVPKDQIVDEEPVLLIVYNNCGETLTSSVCPYFRSRKKGMGINCSKCPMSIAGNECKYNSKNSTWNFAQALWIDLATEDDIKELKKLVLKYNKNIEGN